MGSSAAAEAVQASMTVHATHTITCQPPSSNVRQHQGGFHTTPALPRRTIMFTGSYQPLPGRCRARRHCQARFTDSAVTTPSANAHTCKWGGACNAHTHRTPAACRYLHPQSLENSVV